MQTDIQRRKMRARVGRVLVSLCCLTLSVSFAEAEEPGPPDLIPSAAPFLLTTDGEQVSLTATQASLKAILEELGRQLHIAVEATIPPEETITTEFTALPLAEALRRLSANYAYVTDSAQDTGKITKIIVTPAGKGAPVLSGAPHNPSTTAAHDAAAQPEPFKFEFDPLASPQHSP